MSNLDNLESTTGRLLSTGVSDENLSTKSKFECGDVLFGKLRPYLRKYWQATFSGVCTTEILVFRAKNNTIPRFLYYLVGDQKFINYVNSRTFGTKMPRTDWKVIKGYKTVKPDPNEQERIVSVLDGIESNINDESQKQIKFKLIKKGLMQDLLTGRKRVPDEMIKEGAINA